MAYAIDVAALAALDAGRIADRLMLLFDLPSGLFGFWSGLGPLEFDTVTYVGAGQLFEVSTLDQGIDGSVNQVAVTLNGMANPALSPDILATIEAEDYHFRPVTIMTGYFDADTMALISVETEWRGTIDRVLHRHQVGSGATLVFELQSRSLEHHKANHRMRTVADQRSIDAADEGLRHVGERVEIFWGRTPPAS